jgi:enoyl-CoA hydratase/carnithine racemase
VAGTQKPVIAAVQGVCIGMSWAMALACDVVIAAEDARFQFAFRHIGLAPDGGAAYLLTRYLPLQRAKEIMYSGRFVSGSEAALNRGLLGIDTLLAVQGQVLQSSTAATVAADALKPNALQMLDAVARQNLLVRHVALLRPDGALLSSSDRRRDKLAVHMPPEFLERVVEQSVSTLAISTPAVSVNMRPYSKVKDLKSPIGPNMRPKR